MFLSVKCRPRKGLNKLKKSLIYRAQRVESAAALVARSASLWAEMELTYTYESEHEDR